MNHEELQALKESPDASVTEMMLASGSDELLEEYNRRASARAGMVIRVGATVARVDVIIPPGRAVVMEVLEQMPRTPATRFGSAALPAYLHRDTTPFGYDVETFMVGVLSPEDLNERAFAWAKKTIPRLV